MRSLLEILNEIEQLEFDLGPDPKNNVVVTFDEVYMGKAVTIRGWHGTHSGDYIEKEGFKVFDHERNPLNPKVMKDRESLLGKGVYFTDSKNIAKNYGEPHPIEVKLWKPYVIGHASIDDLRMLNIEKIKSKGYDGIVCQGGKYGLTGESYRQGVAFYEKSIKINRDKPVLKNYQKGAKVRNKETGETGEIKMVWGKKFLQIKWNGSKRLGTKPRGEYNVERDNVELIV